MRLLPLRSLAIVSVLGAAALSQAQLRIACWNITNWGVTSPTNARMLAVRTAVYGVFNGRSMAPDVIAVQEMQSQAAMNALVQGLNTAPGSPGDWAAFSWPTPISPQTSLPDTQSVLLYRTSKIVPAGPVVTVSQGVPGSTTEPPRNTYRFDFHPVGYVTPSALISVYNVHLKAGSTTNDESRRLVEAQRIRLNANSLTTRGGVLVAGDLNIGRSSAASYQELTGTQVNNTGRFFDPISTPGTWENSFNFRYVHTQDPWVSSATSTNVGMDDRYDFMLMDSRLLDGEGLHYIGNPNLPYSTTTWNDPNHSYRVWGNDGSSWIFQGGNWLSKGLTVAGNTMVGPTIAQALVDSTGNQSGHLPLFADFRVPPVANVQEVTLDFGLVGQGTTATMPINVNNVGNIALWGPFGVADLVYSVNGANGFSAPNGIFNDRADDGPQTHLISVNTSTPGRVNGTVTINTNDPFRQSIVVNCTALVVGRITRPTPVPGP